MNRCTSLPRRYLLAASLCFLVADGGLPLAVIAQDAPPSPPNAVPNGSVNFQKAPPAQLVDLYEQLTGKHLIRDANLDGFPPVSMNASGLSKTDTIKMIEATLLLNNIAIVPLTDDTDKVVTIGATKNPKSEGVQVYANAADLPAEDKLVNYYMPLNYISPVEAATIFQSVTPFHPNYGGYTPAPSVQAIILTENTSVIRQLIALKDLIDAPPAHVTSEWIQLNSADSDKTADLLNKLLGLGPTGAPAAGGAPQAAANGNLAMVPATLGNTAPLSNEHNLISGSAQIISDPRANRILVVTRPVNIPFIEQMIAQLDQPDHSQVPMRRPLKYVLAQDILPAIEAALAQGKDEETQVQKDQTTAQNQQNRNGQAGGTQAQPVAGGNQNGGGGSSGSVAAITPQLAAPNENNVPTVIIIGKTRLMADNRSNSVIVFGSPDIVKRTFAMIDQLDRKPLQVYLATVIGQLTVQQGEEFGIDILNKFQHIGQGGIASSNINTPTTLGLGGTGTVPEPAALISSTGFPLFAGLNLYGMIGSTLNAYVRALESTDRFKIVSRPSVYTSNNKLAVIASGSQVPVPQSTTSGFTGGSTTTDNLTTTSSIAYEQVLLQLDIIPLINADHEVTLKIRQTNNSLGTNVVISGNAIPTINTQEINTEVTVPNKATVVIGGLITDQTTRDTSGVPLLSDIPLLGYLFKDTKKSKKRDELIIMIQPSVVETDADQLAVNEEEKQRTILGREAAEAALNAPQLPQPGLILTPPPSMTTTTETKTSSVYNSKTGTNVRTTTQTTLRAVPLETITPLGPTTPTGPIPAVSSPAPNVSNGQLPRVNPPVQPTTAP